MTRTERALGALIAITLATATITGALTAWLG